MPPRSRQRTVLDDRGAVVEHQVRTLVGRQVAVQAVADAYVERIEQHGIRKVRLEGERYRILVAQKDRVDRLQAHVLHGNVFAASNNAGLGRCIVVKA